MKLNKKRMLVSLGVGIIVFVIASLLMLFTWKLLNSPDWMSTVLVWIIAWPVMLTVRVVSIPHPGRGGMAFAVLITTAIDIGILSAVIYGVLSLFGTNSRSASPPPPSFS